jgi:S-DNA-T family DNA segregation ATPase FtsK/SpoIIIE
LVVDGVLPPGGQVAASGGPHGVTALDLPERWAALGEGPCLRLVLEDGVEPGDGRLPVRALRPHEAPVQAVADQCDLATAEAFARRLSPLPASTDQAGVDSTRTAPRSRGKVEVPPDLLDLLDLGDVRRYDPGSVWRNRQARDHLRVPIGLGEEGGMVHLDLKESALQGMGPHGLVIGATGSGKSELLRTMVLGLALTHSPERLNMVLVDFKGGATFAGMAAMPHVSALITNLADELTLLVRMQDALSGELVRRQELLRD